MAHTPGPWHIVQVALGPGIVGNNGVPVAQCHSAFADVERDNSRLIAAAPLMLEALRELLVWETRTSDCPCERCKAVDAAEAALAAAEGEGG
jgi:hypothetical protein